MGAHDAYYASVVGKGLIARASGSGWSKSRFVCAAGLSEDQLVHALYQLYHVFVQCSSIHNQSTDYFSDEGYGISSSVLTGYEERVPAVSPKLHQEQHSDFRHHSLPASVAYGEGAPVSEALDSMMKRIPGSGNTVHSDSPIYMASTFSRDSVPVDGKPRTVLGIGHRRRQPSFQGLAEVEHREAVATSQRSKQV